MRIMTTAPRWREIVVVTGGVKPQVATETLYALARRPVDPIVPDKIVCVVTQGVAAGFGPEFERQLARLRANLGLAPGWRRDGDRLAGREGLFVVFPVGRDGAPIDDIRSDADAAAFGDLVCDVVRAETADPKTRVHLSLAGGRKTMSFHAGAALSLFGRAQDELSHVLVYPADLERRDDFWFPGAPHERVELALIPFIRLRERLDPALLARPMDYAAYVARINASASRAPLSLELITCERRVRIGDIADFVLPNKEFALYQLMAEWARDRRPGADASGLGPERRGWLAMAWFGSPPPRIAPNPIRRFLAIYEATFKAGGRAPARVTAAPRIDAEASENLNYFMQTKSKLVKALRRELPEESLARRFGAPPTPVEAEGVSVFGLQLAPADIAIREQ